MRNRRLGVPYGGGRPPHAGPHDGRPRAPRPGRARCLCLRRLPRRSGPSAPVHHRPVAGGVAADAGCDRSGDAGVQRRDLQPRRAAPGAGARGTRVPNRSFGHRDPAAGLPALGPAGHAAAPCRHVRVRRPRRGRGHGAPRARQGGHQAAVLRGDWRRPRIRLGNQGAAQASRAGGPAGQGALLPLPDVPLAAGPADALREAWPSWRPASGPPSRWRPAASASRSTGIRCRDSGSPSLSPLRATSWKTCSRTPWCIAWRPTCPSACSSPAGSTPGCCCALPAGNAGMSARSPSATPANRGSTRASPPGPSLGASRPVTTRSR